MMMKKKNILASVIMPSDTFDDKGNGNNDKVMILVREVVRTR